MIAFIRGPVAAVEEDGLVVDTGSLGLLVQAPMSTLNPRPVIGEEIQLHTFLQVREDAWNLYGFANREQLKSFRLLLGVSGVGAKTALAILDKVSPAQLTAAVMAQDPLPLTAASGVGKKSAARILLALKDKFPELPGDGAELAALPLAGELNRDLLAALKQLGYTATEARAFAIQAEAALGSGAAVEDLLREALKIALRS